MASIDKGKLRAAIARECLAIENGIMTDSITLRELIKRRAVLSAAIDTLVKERLDGK